MIEKPGLLFRVDANRTIGIGHVMRCLALAQAWQDEGGEAIFVLAKRITALEERLKSEGMEVVLLSAKMGSNEDAIETVNLAKRLKASWVVADGSHFDDLYQRTIRGLGVPFLLIDDMGGKKRHFANMILNQNIYAHEAMYLEREPATQLLLGSQYVLLRREFLKWKGWTRQVARVGRKVLVTLGGSDPNRVTLKLIQALQEIKWDKLEVTVVVGDANPEYGRLEGAVRDTSASARLVTAATNMPELMAWTDVAVAAGGITSWELAFMGVPTTALILSDNQKSTVEHLNERGVIVNLGASENFSASKFAQTLKELLGDFERRLEMMQRARELVDGEGAGRVIMHLQGEPFRLRKIREEDCRQIWEWSNDPKVRKVSFSTEEIPWEQHVRWFQSKLVDPRCAFYVAVNENEVPVGQIRYDLKGEDAVISVSLAESFRGRGLGNKIIKCASKKLFANFPVARVHAYVKDGNDVSVPAFVRAGYQRIGPETIQGNPTVHLFLERTK